MKRPKYPRVKLAVGSLAGGSLVGLVWALYPYQFINLDEMYLKACQSQSRMQESEIDLGLPPVSQQTRCSVKLESENSRLRK